MYVHFVCTSLWLVCVKCTYVRKVPLVLIFIIRSYLNNNKWTSIVLNIKSLLYKIIHVHAQYIYYKLKHNFIFILFHCCIKCPCEADCTSIIDQYINATKLLNCFINSSLYKASISYLFIL